MATQLPQDPPDGLAQIIPFYDAALRLNKRVPVEGRMLALASLLEDDTRTQQLMGAARWHGPRAAERDSALARLRAGWEAGPAKQHSQGAHLQALRSLILGIPFDEAAAMAEAVALVSWLVGNDLALRPDVMRAGAVRRLALDARRLGFEYPGLSGVDLAIAIAPPVRRFPALVSGLGWGQASHEVPKATPGGRFVPMLLAFNAGWETAALPEAAIADYPLILNLDVGGFPGADRRGPDTLSLMLRIKARQDDLARQFLLGVDHSLRD